MLKNTTILLCLLGGIALSLGISITPIIKEGSTEVAIAPFVRIGNGVYYFEREITVNWYQAFENCRRLNATLITIDTMQEWIDVTKFLEKYKDETPYWTSGNDLAQEGRHVWFGSGNTIGINIWAAGQPSNDNGNEHCDHLNHRKPNTHNRLGLNDASCTTKFRYICEAPNPYTASFVIWK